MMLINLLPWREQLAQKQQKLLLVSWFVSTLLVIAIIIIWHLRLTYKLKRQKIHNDNYSNSIIGLNTKINVLKGLQQEYKVLIKRVQKLKLLKQQQSHSTKALRELAHKTPTNIYLTQIKQQANTITLTGITTSHRALINFIAILKQSSVLSTPQLQKTTTKHKINFILYCQLKP